MITKAIVEDASDRYSVKVRIPFYDRASVAPRRVLDEDLPQATICTLPNSGLNVRKGDIVFVSFEDDDIGRPVIVGCLYTNKVSDTGANIFAETLGVATNAKLPKSTSIGDVSSEELQRLVGLEDNAQGQIDTLQEDLDAVPVIKSVGRDSLIQKTVNIETDVDRHGNPIDRTNVAYGGFSAVFGSRNMSGQTASESLISGGNNEDYGQDNVLFGYRCKSYANQSLTGGHDCANKASESAQIGSGLTMNATVTLDSYGSPTSNSKYNAQFGHNCTMDENTLSCFQFGETISQGVFGKWNAQFGTKHSIGEYNECVTVFDFHNTTGNFITDSIIAGYDNVATNDYGDSEHKKYDIYMFGHENKNKDENGNDHSNIYELGKGLRPTKDDQVIVGAWNSGVSNAWFEVGYGTSNTNRKTAFAVCVTGSSVSLKLGGTSLTENELQALKNLLT